MCSTLDVHLRFGCRPATKESFDDAALPVGVPSFIPVGGTADPSASRFYFMTVKLVVGWSPGHMAAGRMQNTACTGTLCPVLCDPCAMGGQAQHLLRNAHHLHSDLNLQIASPRHVENHEHYKNVLSQVAKRTRSICSSTITSSSDSSACLGSAVEGLEVGHLLGKGAYGKVYSGNWFGTPVAVKVRALRLS